MQRNPHEARWPEPPWRPVLTAAEFRRYAALSPREFEALADAGMPVIRRRGWSRVCVQAAMEWIQTQGRSAANDRDAVNPHDRRTDRPLMKLIRGAK